LAPRDRRLYPLHHQPSPSRVDGAHLPFPDIGIGAMLSIVMDCWHDKSRGTGYGNFCGLAMAGLAGVLGAWEARRPMMSLKAKIVLCVVVGCCASSAPAVPRCGRPRLCGAPGSTSTEVFRWSAQCRLRSATTSGDVDFASQHSTADSTTSRARATLKFPRRMRRESRLSPDWLFRHNNPVFRRLHTLKGSSRNASRGDGSRIELSLFRSG